MLSILHWRCVTYYLGYVKTSHILSILHWRCKERGRDRALKRREPAFNTPLEMPAPTSGRWAAAPTSEAFNTPLEMQLAPEFSDETFESFNTPLEMPASSLIGSRMVKAMIFQYSIGDAGDLPDACTFGIIASLSILHWRCTLIGALIGAVFLVFLSFNTPLEMLYTRRYSVVEVAISNFQYSIGDARH